MLSICKEFIHCGYNLIRFSGVFLSELKMIDKPQNVFPKVRNMS